MGHRSASIVTALLVLAGASGGARSAELIPVVTQLPGVRSIASRIYFGGSIGVSFGSVDYVQVSPQVGFEITPKLSTGLAVSYLRRSYSGLNTVSTSDRGFDVFTRYRLISQVFLQGQYSYTDFEYPLAAGGTTRDSYSAFLAGGGWARPLGGHVSFVTSAMYDFTYSEDEPAPYDDPWIVSAGVIVGF